MAANPPDSKRPDGSRNGAARTGPARLTLAIDAMGGDAGPEPVVEGVLQALASGVAADILLVGDQAVLTAIVAERASLNSIKILHAPTVVSMTDKPMHVLRRGRDTSMWAAVTAVAEGKADAIVSGGNTGALMAVSRRQLGMIEGIDRPAVTALWPSPHGRVVVLDVGANVEADESHLVNFAIMGEAFFRALTGKKKPTVGLLNVGAEELKGHGLIRNAARVLREADPEMAFRGFVEGNDISKGTVDVVVTDGFTGNIALKSAEGAARLIARWVKEAHTGSLVSRIGAFFMMGELKKLKDRMDPSTSNGGVFLGLKGTVVKSHGGADANGVASAIAVAVDLARNPFQAEVSETIAKVAERSERVAQSERETAKRNVNPQAAE